jgi:hypothetical protein
MPSSIVPPPFEALPAEVKTWVHDASALLKVMPVEQPGTLSFASSLFKYDCPVELESLIKQCLIDPLQDKFNEYHGPDSESLLADLLSRTEIEKYYVSTLAKNLEKARCSHSFDQFIECIEAASSHFLKERSTIRTWPVYLAPDVKGHYVEYMNHSVVKDTLLMAFRTMLDEQAPVLYRASVSYVLLVAAHPFRDGNGRLSRTLFNAILINEGMREDAYISLKQISYLSRGALAIQLRRAQMRNVWPPVLAGLSGAVILTDYIRRSCLSQARGMTNPA